MAHSIELLFDDDSDQVIRAQWQALADAGLPSQVRVTSPTNRPHITLLAAERISDDVDDTLRALAAAAVRARGPSGVRRHQHDAGPADRAVG